MAYGCEWLRKREMDVRTHAEHAEAVAECDVASGDVAEDLVASEVALYEGAVDLHLEEGVHFGEGPVVGR